jgi:glycosyltransferase involved in cell wall biosynthesis
MIVSNPCNPDYRVIKEAESLVRHGHKVRIFCTSKAGLPQEETINGVEYLRASPPRKAAAVPKVVLVAPEPQLRPRPQPAASRPEAPPAEPIAARLPEPAAQEARHGIAVRLQQRSLTELRRLRRQLRFVVRRSIPRLGIPLRPATAKARTVRAALRALAIAPFVRLVRAPFITKRTKFRTTMRLFAPLVTAWRPDIVHAHDLICLPAGHAAAEATGARLVYDSHELEIHRNPPLPYLLKRHHRALEARHIRQADAVITVCEPLADHLAREYRIARPAVVYNAPTVETRAQISGMPPRQRGWKSLGSDVRDIRAEAGVPAGGLLGVYVGLVTLNRGIETMIDALEGLPHVWFVAVGPRNEAIARTLIARAAAKGVAGRFSILPAVHPDSVVDFISGADFGVNPLKPVTLSYNFAMPNKIFEMSLAGLAIVNSDAQETARFVTENGIGVVFDHRDPADCVRAVRHLTGDIASYRPSPEKLARMRDRYGWHRQEETLVRLYDGLLAPASAQCTPVQSKARA